MDATVRTNETGHRYTLSIERRFDRSPEQVWRVLTERELLKQWFPCDVDGDWVVGAALTFIFPPEYAGAELTEDDLQGEVLAVDAPKLLAFRWGKHGMRFELTPHGDGCRFTLSESFDDKIWCARDAAGWDICIENIDLILDGVEVAKFVAEEWRVKFDYYAEKFKAIVGPRGGLAEDDPLLKLGREA